MVGSQGIIGKSLQRRLSFWVSIVLIVMGVSAGLVSYISAYQEAVELQDDQLRQLAKLIQNQHLLIPDGENDIHITATSEDAFLVAQFAENEKPSPQERELFDLVEGLPNGMQTIPLQGHSWRVLLARNADASRLVVGQRKEVSDDAATDAGQQTLLPIVILIPLMLFVVRALVRGMFAPLTRLASRLDKRVALTTTDIGGTDVPAEIAPFLAAMNRLFKRLADAAAFQRRFMADAAHELRSPLTALSLQAERLGAEGLQVQEAATRLDTLQKGMARTRALLDQLLNFAHSQEDGAEEARTPLSLQSVLRLVLEDLLPIAEAKSIDIGLTGTQDALVTAREAEIVSIMKNLIDNALRYTPEGGRVDMRIETMPEGAIFQIDDTGPGIPPEERERVFDPFYRMLGNDVSGSGLGLSIVKATTERCGATIHLDYVDEEQKTGLRTRVVFPLSS